MDALNIIYLLSGILITATIPTIIIDIPTRSISVKLSDEELAAREQLPLKRNRVVSKALRAYAQSVSSADKGGIRLID